MLKPYLPQSNDTTNFETNLKNFDTKFIVNKSKKNMSNFGNIK